MIGRHGTFDRLNDVLHHMNMGKFNKFLRDFQISVPQSKIKEIFLRKGKEIGWEIFLVHKN